MAKNPFSFNSSCHSLITPRTLVSGFLGREKISDYFSELSSPDDSSADNKDSDGTLGPLLLRHTPKPGGQKIKRTPSLRLKSVPFHIPGKKKTKNKQTKKQTPNTVMLDKPKKTLFFFFF